MLQLAQVRSSSFIPAPQRPRVTAWGSYRLHRTVIVDGVPRTRIYELVDEVASSGARYKIDHTARTWQFHNRLDAGTAEVRARHAAH